MERISHRRGSHLRFLCFRDGRPGNIELPWSVTDPPRPFVGPIVGAFEIALSAGIMFACAGRWPRHAVGLIFGWGAVSSLGVLIFPSDKVSRQTALVLFVYCVLVNAMLYRFHAPHQPPPTLLDRCALTLFGLSTASLISLMSIASITAALTIGLVPLGVAWAVSRKDRAVHRLSKNGISATA
jgi:hypothetical protein